jgi:hypothetical protein
MTGRARDLNDPYVSSLPAHYALKLTLNLKLAKDYLQKCFHYCDIMMSNHKANDYQSPLTLVKNLEDFADSSMALVEFDILELGDRATSKRSDGLAAEHLQSPTTHKEGSKDGMAEGMSVSLPITGTFKQKQALLTPTLPTRFKTQGFTPISTAGTASATEGEEGFGPDSMTGVTPVSMAGKSPPAEAVVLESKSKAKPTDLLSPDSMKE